MRACPRVVLPGAALLFVLAAAGPAAAQPLPELTGPVNDLAGVIEPSNEARIEDVIRRLQAASGDVIIVATVETVAPYANTREYAVKLFENHGRGIGQRDKDNGLLVVLAMKEREVQIEVGYGLEPFITDGFAGETSRVVMAPHFRRGEFGEGLLRGVARLAGRIAEGRGVELEGVPRPAPPARSAPEVPGILIVFLVLTFSIVMRIVSGFSRRRRRSRWGRRDTWSGWHSGVGPFGGGFGGGLGGGFGGFGGGGGGFGGFGGGRSGGGGGGASW